MKKFLFIALMTAALSAPALAGSWQDTRNAEHQQQRQERHDEHLTREKAARSREISRRISGVQRKLSCLQTLQTCVNAAPSESALNRCHGCPD